MSVQGTTAPWQTHLGLNDLRDGRCRNGSRKYRAADNNRRGFRRTRTPIRRHGPCPAPSRSGVCISATRGCPSRATDSAIVTIRFKSNTIRVPISRFCIGVGHPGAMRPAPLCWLWLTLPPSTGNSCQMMRMVPGLVASWSARIASRTQQFGQLKSEKNTMGRRGSMSGPKSEVQGSARTEAIRTSCVELPGVRTTTQDSTTAALDCPHAISSSRKGVNPGISR